MVDELAFAEDEEPDDTVSPPADAEAEAWALADTPLNKEGLP